MTFDSSQHPRNTDGKFSEKVGSQAEVSLPAAQKPDTLVQDVKDAWDERHAKKADISFRIEEATAVMRSSQWHPAMPDMGDSREKDKYLSAEYRLAEALAERDASRMLVARAVGTAGKSTGSVEAGVVGGTGNALASLISLPRTLKMFRLKRLAARHPELRELDATVNSRPETRRELIDSRAAAFARENGRPDPAQFAAWLRDFYRLDFPMDANATPQERAVRRDAELTRANVLPAAREAYLSNDPQRYIDGLDPRRTDLNQW
jgi:hypothetical protein